MSTPKRQVRAVHDADTVTVYQAYPPAPVRRRRGVGRAEVVQPGAGETPYPLPVDVAARVGADGQGVPG
ncbi:hypothetical protein [Promicromonospora sukumoe]|uniref:hypothetical protein n=1 Tax=Promicromonospora sukumoe TaxID=88382 RepID=UPI0003749E36|nr:hypothetical protein [Promicromonospora sukumoe]